MAPRKRGLPVALPEAASSGDHRQLLEALRDRLAAEAAEADGRTLPALAKQLADVARSLAELPAAKEATAVDDLTARRAARRRAATGP